MRPLPRPRFAMFAVLCSVLMSSSLAETDQRATLSASDVTRIRARMEQYRTGWLANDADTVRKTFAKDAVLMPHHGLAPVVGMAAINEFWWPAGRTKTIITRFEQTIDEIGGDSKLAYMRGRSEVTWTVEDQGKIQHWHNSGNFMAIFRKQADGGWLVSHLIWDDPPNQLE